jgi:hypothetical protein
VLLGNRIPSVGTVARRVHAFGIRFGPPGGDHGAQGSGDRSISVGRGVLIDEGRPHGTMAHPVHQLSRGRTGVCSELIAGVPQIMKVKADR